MIPIEYQNMHLWLRINIRIIANALKTTRPGDLWNRAFLHGARHILVQLSKQWAHDVRVRRMMDERKN